MWINRVYDEIRHSKIRHHYGYFVSIKGLATSVHVSRSHLIPVPPNWSLEDAATVPFIYGSLYLALVIRGRIEKNQRVLVHSGGTLNGQAAISIALQHGCKVYTSVGSSTEISHLKSAFPQLTDQNFVISNDEEFHRELLKKTRTNMTVIVGAIASNKLEGSLQILEPNGQLIEVGEIRLTDKQGTPLVVDLK